MEKIIISRRRALEAGVCAVAAVASVPGYAATQGSSGLSQADEQAIRKYYAAWEKKDWAPFDALLADNFTFTSANDDDHISKAIFKTRCWETQIDHIARFELLHLYGSNHEALVMYIGSTKNGKKFRNTEYFRLKEGRVEAIECYFGAMSSFASSVSKGRG